MNLGLRLLRTILGEATHAPYSTPTDDVPPEVTVLVEARQIVDSAAYRYLTGKDNDDD